MLLKSGMMHQSSVQLSSHDYTVTPPLPVMFDDGLLHQGKRMHAQARCARVTPVFVPACKLSSTLQSALILRPWAHLSPRPSSSRLSAQTKSFRETSGLITSRSLPRTQAIKAGAQEAAVQAVLAVVLLLSGLFLMSSSFLKEALKGAKVGAHQAMF